MMTGTFCEPPLDEFGFVGVVVVHDQVCIQFCGHRGLNAIEKGAELSSSVGRVGSMEAIHPGSEGP